MVWFALVSMMHLIITLVGLKITTYQVPRIVFLAYNSAPESEAYAARKCTIRST